MPRACCSPKRDLNKLWVFSDRSFYIYWGYPLFYLFIWLHWVPAAAHGAFAAAHRLSSTQAQQLWYAVCRIQQLLTRVQTLVPCIARQFLTNRPSGKSLQHLFLEINQAYIQVHCSITCNSKQVKATQGSIFMMNKENVIHTYTHNGILLSPKNERNPVILQPG